MGSKCCHPLQSKVRQIKTPVQSVENPKGTGGVILYDLETIAINKPHLMAVPDHRALIRGKSSVRPF
ncbi:hypothetical protein R3I93_014862 [Phoxinus phoxinus]|uniref:Uncharacterized protein n=1 Tax=Phoxinus phoxinus TaxID=58324 RepID=A0AAN9CQW7_9TELE